MTRDERARRAYRGGLAVLGLLALACATPGPFDQPHDFEDANDQTVFELKGVSGGAVEVEDGAGKMLYLVTPSEDGVRIQGASGEALGSVSLLADGEGYVVKDATGRELYKLRVEADRDFKLRGADGQNLYVGKHRSYGYKVMNAADEVESRVKVRSDRRVSVRDAADQKYLSTKIEGADPLAMAVVTLKDIPFVYAAGLSVAVTLDHFAPEGAQP